ncbi:B-cell receptor CD22-like isoform X3 [Ostrea edulis]|uniref:B-cell receptor CD22-like isoform X3 n=1 Tax=Ostrea edulis TaxID=37623 RepID=UPI0024AFB300|nr:B-cell receptor CD22-like isoform X3 [Ostrea edulis]
MEWNRKILFRILTLQLISLNGVQLQTPAYIIQNTPGCLNISISSNIPSDFTIFISFNTTLTVCSIIGIPDADPIIVFAIAYRGRITCEVNVPVKRADICFTAAVNESDAGVYYVRLGTSSDITTTTLFVMNPPLKPTINTHGLIVSSTVHNLTCSSTSTSTPTTGLLITYSWTVNDANITDPRFTISGQGGRILTINKVLKQDKGKRVQCIATEEKGMSSDPSDEKTLDVLYTPEVIITPSTNVVVELGKTNVQLECSVYDSNPTTGLMYRWTKDGSQISTNQTVIMRTVRKSDQGSYQCIASNSVGTSVPATVTVEVLYIPEIERFTVLGEQTVTESDPFSMLCSVHSPRPANITIHNLNTSEVISRGYNVLSLNFTESSARCLQTAVYGCSAENIVGITKSAPLEFLVKCMPRSLNGLYFQQFSTENLHISARFLAYPLPSIQWTFRKTSTAPETAINDDFWNTAITTTMNTSISSVLVTKESLQLEQFGYYTANASNDQGSFITTFLVQPEGNSVIIPNLESGLYTFTLIATNTHGESLPATDNCQIKGLNQETDSLVPVLGSLFGFVLLICIGLVSFIIITKVLRQKRIICCRELDQNQDYVLENVTRADNHQYQDITTKPDRSGHQEAALSSQHSDVENSESGNVYDKVDDSSGHYINTG